MTKLVNGFDSLNSIEARKTIIDLLASLTAAHSLLSRSPKLAAPSDRIFDKMLEDYAASIERGREALKRL